MIVNELYDGQGLGNQLWNYALTRIISDKQGFEFAITGKEHFKGREFMDLDFGSEIASFENYYKEKYEYFHGSDIDISRTDPLLLNLSELTKFDGNCQSTKYLVGYRDRLRDWIKIKPQYTKYITGNEICLIHFRAGDFKKIKEVFLPVKYYMDAMARIRLINPQVRFCCVTDEPDIVRRFLPTVEIIGSANEGVNDKSMAVHHRGGPIGIDFAYLLNAKYIIIPNSSFSWWPAYLNVNAEMIIAPKYWARHNISDGYWSTSDIITDDFTYIDRKGVCFTSTQCWEEKTAYEEMHPEIFAEKPYFSLSKRVKKTIRSYFNRLKENSPDTSLPLRRGGSKIYDIFTFFNELELLEIRLRMLDEYVDYFVIIESTETFSGRPKKLFFEENKQRFAKYSHKIIHYVTKDTPTGLDDLKERLKSQKISNLDREIINSTLNADTFSKEHIHWLKEFYQKESIKKALVGLHDEDLCFISDLDEIWNPDVRFDYMNRKIYRLRQLMYAYYLNNRSSEKWAGTLATRYDNIRDNCINYLRDPKKTKYCYLNNGGWHFTNIGGADRIRMKLESYGHQEFNNDAIKSDLENKIALNKDFTGRRFKFRVDELNLPNVILEYKSIYPNFFK